MITVNCQSSIRIENGGLAIYFDPLKIAERHDANCIFITHSHWDHFSPEDIQKAVNESTIIVAPRDVYDKLAETGFDANKLRCVQPNDELDLDGVHVQAVPAYNIDKDFHLKANNWVGYVVTINNAIYYIMGDTDALPENENIRCDTLFIPIGGTYTMDATEAANFTNRIRPTTAIPTHYGMVVGTHDDFVKYKSLVDTGINVVEKIKLD